MLPESHDWIRVLMYSLFASFGGIVGYLMRTIDNRQKIKWYIAVVEGIAAGFVGMLVFLACEAIGVGEEWTGVIVGVCGWLGANASIRLLEALIFKKLGIKPIDHSPVRERQDDS